MLHGNPTPVRWGDRRDVAGQPNATVPEQQFIDLDLGEPRELLVTLTATMVPPVAGWSIRWRLYWGGGAAMVVEPLTVPIDDFAAPTPILLRRSASKLRVSCEVINVGAAAPLSIAVSAFAGPVLAGR